jgi:hypothetical protein
MTKETSERRRLWLISGCNANRRRRSLMRRDLISRSYVN